MKPQAYPRDGLSASGPATPSPTVARVTVPPIPEAQGWLAGYDGSHGPVVDMSQAVPGYAPAAFFTERFAEAATRPDNARYGSILGNAALRAAYAEHVAALYGAAIEPASTAITAGCNQAFFTAAMVVAGSGDSILLPTPWYFNHQMTLAMLGITPTPVETQAEDGFIPTVEAVEAAILPSSRALVLVTPNNPTGAVCPPERIEALFELCRRRGLYLILDETYRDFLKPEGGAPHGLFGRPDWQDTLIALYSFSKSYAIPGHRLGAMSAGPGVLTEAEKVLDCMQICPPRPSQAALAPSIAGTAEWRAGKSREIRDRAGTFRSAMAAATGWDVVQAGAYFAYVRHPYAGRDARSVSRFLAQRLGLLTLPGSYFGPGQEGYLRIAFANVDDAGIAAFAARLAAHGMDGPLEDAA
jgi:aspartate/methionine/tyrosine aminotransferase